MNKQKFDSGLISVFRLFTAIRFSITLLGMGLAITGLRGPADRQEPVNWISLIESGTLLCFLSWPWLRRKMGKWFLITALTITTLGPIASSIQWNISAGIPIEIIQARALMSQWQLVIILLMPLILISWRYGFPASAGYAVVIDFIDLVLLTFLNTSPDWHPVLVVSILLFRTLFYLLIAYTITRLAAELRAQNAHLENANRQLALSAITMEQLAVSRERNRLAREFHDTLAHTMSGMAVQLEAAETVWTSKPEQARGMVKDALRQIRQGLGEARRAIQALRAAPIEDMGLLLALQHLAKNEAERGGLKLTLHLPDQIPQLSNEVEHTFYRVAEEALHNAVHHAGASQVLLNLTALDGKISMTIQDNGTGFDQSAPAPEDRYGLQGMQERAEAINGQFQIISSPGKGTIVMFTLEGFQ